MTPFDKYVKQLLDRGYDTNYIVSYLQSQGYSAHTIRTSIDHVTNQQHHGLHEQLRSYIQQMIAQGYTVEQVRQALLNQGYSSTLIKDLFRAVDKDVYGGKLGFYTPKRPPHVKTPLIMLAIVIIVGVIIAGIIQGWFFSLQTNNGEDNPTPQGMFSLDTPSQLDMNSTTLKVMYEGDSQLVNKPLRLTVYSQRGDIITFSQHDIVGQQQEIRMSIPTNVTAGSYSVTGEVYAPQLTQATTQFSIGGEEASTPTNTPTSTPLPFEENNQSSYVTVQSKESVFTTALEQTNADDAIGMCRQSNSVDDCLYTAALKHDRFMMCQHIQSPVIRDECYVTFALNGQEDACEYVVAQDEKEFCESATQ